ncbi:MAG: lamin tail domain-containing protein [Planctomycetes bacterium]|nr:lamin tail domain-containing protein [Planctomycetota bacterium]
MKHATVTATLFAALTAALVASLAAAPGGRVLAGEVIINEVHYEPTDETKLEELVELYNAGAAAADLSGWYFSDGIRYTFPQGTVMGPGEYLVVAESPEAIQARFGLARVLGPFEGRLSNDGERLLLRNAAGSKEDEVDYGVGFPWPIAPAGKGSSLELLSPELDNDLGGSWRPSGGLRSLPLEPVTVLGAKDPTWHYRKGTSEASDPPSAWRQVDFVEDATWLVGQTSVGFGDDDDSTVLTDMLDGYTSVYFRHPFEVARPEDIPAWLKLRLYVDDGAIVWVNGVEVARSHVSAGDKAYDAVGRTNEAKWEEIYIPAPRAFLNVGKNVVAAHGFNVTRNNNDFSFDLELLVPARNELPPAPTPGEANSVLDAPRPPQVRQVAHDPRQPRSGEPFLVTAKVTDPDGVASVSARYQVVLPGSYVPSHLALEPAELMATPTKALPPNPVFEDPASWIELPLRDDGKGGDAAAGDSVYTATLPPQGNRTLVRYRIAAADATGASVTCPYADDPSLNFALFVHDGVPSYVTTRATVHPEGVGYTYPAEVLAALPTYFLITRNSEVQRCVAYNGAWQIPKGNENARDAFNWEGAFVYDGVAYDHVHYRLRQANDRYGGGGKRSWRIRFNVGHHLQAHDGYGRPYPTRWRTLNTGKMFDNKGVGNFGLTEPLNTLLWNLSGVPAPFMHTFHFRVVDGPDEAPGGTNGQYSGDFWGMAIAVEDYDPRFVEAHGLPDGNLYKLKDGIFVGNQLKRNQGRHAVTTDADFQNIRNQLRPAKDEAWLDQHVRYEKWYPYHAVVEAIRHYDFVPADSHSKNRSWFFEPAEGSPLGRLWTLPWDHDASWGPNWNDGIDYSKNAIFAAPGKPSFRLRYRNALREFRDICWQEGAIHAMIDDLAAFIAELAKADRDRWRGAPPAEGTQDFGTLEAKVADMKKFAFVGWSGATGPTVPAGGRAKHLDVLANAEGDSTSIPATPVVAAVGPPHFPIDNLVFEASAFSDPQGDDTFAALKWRLGEVWPAGTPFDPRRPRPHEWTAVWESEEIPERETRVHVPPGLAIPGRTYRVRVKMKDSTGRWSHWSAPLEFKASPPDAPVLEQQHLRVTEVMYNPADSGDAEFVEVQNTGPVPLDLSQVRFSEGIELSFAGSAVTRLEPGEHAVVVRNRAVFEARYGAAGIKVAGEYGGKLDNEGDEIALQVGSSLTVQRFAFDDAWYPETDGGGYSLVIVNPGGAADLWSKPEGWRPSRELHGSPGRGDDDEPPRGLQVPGDITQDAQLNLTDAVALLGHLFQGAPERLPCDGDTGSPANRALADSNGDGAVNLTDAIAVLRYLFLGDAPPALGAACTRILGCPSACEG